MIKYSDEYLADVASRAVNMVHMMELMGYTNNSGSVGRHLKSRLERAKIDTSHWTGRRHDEAAHPFKHTPDTILVMIAQSSLRRAPPSILRRCLIEYGRIYECAVESCRVTEWQGRPILLQVDHIDGDWRNNKPDNLRFLCPNCHTQTDNWSLSKVAVAQQKCT